VRRERSFLPPALERCARAFEDPHGVCREDLDHNLEV
jgi:hypothetical protein